jgi:hypothetical protein
MFVGLNPKQFLKFEHWIYQEISNIFVTYFYYTLYVTYYKLNGINNGLTIRFEHVLILLSCIYVQHMIVWKCIYQKLVLIILGYVFTLKWLVEVYNEFCGQL